MGPLLRNSSFKNVKLMAGDDQRFVMPWWFKQVKQFVDYLKMRIEVNRQKSHQMQEAHPESVKYLDGFAVHWYWDVIALPSLLDKTHRLYPDKFILNTESCLGNVCQ